MKSKLFVLCALMRLTASGQDFINPYSDYLTTSMGTNFPEVYFTNPNSYYKFTPYFNNPNTMYNGEYEIIINELETSWYDFFTSANLHNIQQEGKFLIELVLNNCEKRFYFFSSAK